MSPIARKSSPKQLWVMPHQDGWQAKHAGKDRAAFVVEKKIQAVKLAREMAKNGKDELIVTDKHNVIRQKDSEGHDPSNIPG